MAMQLRLSRQFLQRLQVAQSEVSGYGLLLPTAQPGGLLMITDWGMWLDLPGCAGWEPGKFVEVNPAPGGGVTVELLDEKRAADVAFVLQLHWAFGRRLVNYDIAGEDE